MSGRPEPAGEAAARATRLDGLDRMMHARSVAVVGASSDPAKIGGKPVALMKQHFGGRVVPVNPNRSEIAGLPTAASVAAMAEPTDLAVVAVAAPAAEAAIDECLARGVGAIVLFSAGFGEIDAAGAVLQRGIADKCAAAGVRLLGPNSIGFINFHAGLYATFSSALDNIWPKPGGVAIASQSGAVGTYIMALAAEAGIGFSHFIATGNEGDVDVADCIDWLARDPHTNVIVAYLEGCRDGARLMQALEAARAAGKPVIAIKPGATDAGLAAVKSHTGMLAGSKAVFDAVLRAHGAWPAASIEEAVDLAQACSLGKLPAGPGTAVITPSGGVGIMLTDAADEAGLMLPPLPSAAAAEIKALLPLASTANPVDTTAQVANDFGLFGQVIEIVARQDGFDILLVFMAHMGKTGSVTETLKPFLHRIAAAHRDRLIVLITRASDDFRADMMDAGFLVFEDPTRAAKAVGALHFFAGHKGKQAGRARASAGRLPVSLLKDAAEGGEAASRLLAELHISEVPVLTAADIAGARRAAAEVGYPVVLKIDSPDIKHKTEVGGVVLGIADEPALEAAWDRMISTVAARAPAARITGAMVSPMLTDGVETIIGTQNDADFGPVVMFGLGGTAAEALKDVVFMPCPVSHEEALGMIGAIRAHALLEGWRGAAPADRAALASAIVSVSEFAAAHSDMVESVEINPFLARSKGGVALDMLLQLRGQTAADQ